ncbi:MAG: hypothetical protein KC583_21400, partial [Myxococcales bacterium]|nr:hypothetical protein [Myxococcales bacterium]
MRRPLLLMGLATVLGVSADARGGVAGPVVEMGVGVSGGVVQAPFLSTDGTRLYIRWLSDFAPAQGFDLYAHARPGPGFIWSQEQTLGAPFNTAGDESGVWESV